MSGRIRLRRTRYGSTYVKISPWGYWLSSHGWIDVHDMFRLLKALGFRSVTGPHHHTHTNELRIYVK